MNEKRRCDWCEKDDLYRRYHDEEWGVPLHDDQKLFEFLLLEGMQAGLSWYTVLTKRENYRLLFDDFDATKIARYDQPKLDSLLKNPGIIRNKLKVNAAVVNAQRFLEIQSEYGSFDKYIWQFTNHEVIDNQPTSMKDLASTSAESDLMSKSLKKRGFKFVGSTICYAFMQATGMVNDHLLSCWKRNATN